MINILKRGRKKKEQTYYTECPNCGCRFTYTDSDTWVDYMNGVKQIMLNGYIDDSKNDKVTCPCCREPVIIKDINWDE